MKLIFFLTWSGKCITVTGEFVNCERKFTKTDTKCYVPGVTLSAQDNEKLLHLLKTRFIRTINWKNVNQNQQYRHETDI